MFHVQVTKLLHKAVDYWFIAYTNKKYANTKTIACHTSHFSMAISVVKKYYTG